MFSVAILPRRDRMDFLNSVMLPRALELFPRRLVTCGPSTRSGCAQWSVFVDQWKNRRGRFLFSGGDSFRSSGTNLHGRSCRGSGFRSTRQFGQPQKNRRLPRSQMGAENHLDPLHPYHTDPPAFGGPQTISFPALVDKAVGDASVPASRPCLFRVAGPIRFIESFGCRGGRKLRHGFGAGSTTITAMQMGMTVITPHHPSVGSFTSFLRVSKTISSSPSNLFPKRSGMTRPFSWWPLPYPRNQPSGLHSPSNLYR